MKNLILILFVVININVYSQHYDTLWRNNHSNFIIIEKIFEDNKEITFHYKGDRNKLFVYNIKRDTIYNYNISSKLKPKEDLPNTVGTQLIKAGNEYYTGLILTTISSILLIIAESNIDLQKPFIISSLIVGIPGIIFSIHHMSHIIKAGKMMNAGK